MNDARLTMRLPSEYLSFARAYAREREMTLTDLVVGYFKRLRESLSIKSQLPPSVSEMVGIIPASDRDHMDEYHGPKKSQRVSPTRRSMGTTLPSGERNS